MRGTVGRLLHAALCLALAGLVGFLSTRFGFRDDWSVAQRASLAPQSVQLLQRLDAPVDIVSYASEGGSLRQGIDAFVARYRAHKSDMRLEFVDPAADPAAMRRLGVSVDGEIALLVVHGILHVLGMDHAEADEAAAMQAKERALLERFHRPR